MVAGPHPLDAVSNCHDYATRVIAGRIRQVGLDRVRAAANITLHRIHARGMNAYHHLPGSGLQIGHILELHDFRTTELVYSNGFHNFLLRAVMLTPPAVTNGCSPAIAPLRSSCLPLAAAAADAEVHRRSRCNPWHTSRRGCSTHLRYARRLARYAPASR